MYTILVFDKDRCCRLCCWWW